MINVTAAITVKPGHGPAFEQAVAEARPRVLENPVITMVNVLPLRVTVI